MNYNREITIDLNSNSAPVVVDAKQGDKDSRILLVHYTSNGEEYKVNFNNLVMLRMRKPDGKSILNDATVNYDGTVSVTFSYQCLNVAGRAYADLLELNSDGQVLSTAPFIVDIQAAPNISEHEALSSSEFQVLLDFLQTGQEIIGQAQEWANGYNGDTPLGESSSIDQPGSNNNAKYWSDTALQHINEAIEDIREETSEYVDEKIEEATADIREEITGYKEDAEAWANGTRNDEPIEEGDIAYEKNAKYWAEQTQVFFDNLEFDIDPNTGELILTTETID